MQKTQDVRIKNFKHLPSPTVISSEHPITEEIIDSINAYRKTIENILNGKDQRLIAIVGPCSIHDEKAALDYAVRLKELSDKLSDKFFIVMRTYFEKPRTNLGWKGLILDPDLNETYDIEKGIRLARKILIQICELGLPVGCEVLDPIIPQYIDELMSWSSIGARTTESQIHRNLASGLSVPVGFKNSTSGDVSVAVNAVKSASSPSSFIGINREGETGILSTTGNKACHIILRGSDTGPNYYEDDIENVKKQMDKLELNNAIIVDCSHSNSRKDYKKQKRVLRNIIEQIIWGETAIKGFMLESNIYEGNQKISKLEEMKYGVSITDSCISFAETEAILTSSYRLLEKGLDE